MKINRAFIKGTNWALAGLLSILGFNNCDFEPRVEYGTPNADYTVKGSVVDKATQKPVKGIRVGYGSLFQVEYGVIPTDYRYLSAADTTDVNGEYELSGNTFPINENETLPVYVNDIDGAENGLYRDTVLQVDFEDAEQKKKSKGWYKGEFVKTIKIELPEQKESDE